MPSGKKLHIFRIMEKERYLTIPIAEDLREKMVFVSGARQVGKTTLARKLLPRFFPNFAYFNWDWREDRRKIFKLELPGDAELLVFDEIHKYSGWKNLIKGLYDKHKERYKILVTGSARLDLFRKAGDSLLGRYHFYTLHPFSLAELIGRHNTFKIFEELPIPSENFPDEFAALEQFGGFPEVLLKQDERALRRWHLERLDRLFREDIRDLVAIRDLGNMQILSDLLPERVGSLLSVNALREDLEVSHKAVRSWLDTLEMFYYHFRIYPFHVKNVRSFKKTPKLYLTDWSEVERPEARFENLLAVHFMKFVSFLRENQGYDANVHFLRTSDGKEVDFLISVNNKPWFCVEVKLSDTQPAPALSYFRQRLQIPFCYQVVRTSGVDSIRDDIRILSADRFLAALI
ncbi:ATP-binding protein [candidate division KSB1 bacterium]|nr:MAG: ATP-binding protein [candidate division KSB1 bacterium]